MAVRNGERFLPDQLASILRQSLLPDELVVCDDASVDGTCDLLSSFARNAPFAVRIFRSPRRLGVNDASIKAIRLCQGDVIAVCDHDDVWADSKLQRCASYFVDPDVLLVVHSAEVVDVRLRNEGRRYPDFRRSGVFGPLELDPWPVLPGFAMVFSASLVRVVHWENRPKHPLAPEMMMAWDQWVYFLARVLGKTVLSSANLCLYRQHGSNATGAPQVLTRLAMLRRTLATGQDAYERRALLADEYSNFLRQLGMHRQEPLLARLLKGAWNYRRVAETWRLRSMLYEPGVRRRVRLGRAYRLISTGAYRRRDLGGLGMRSLAKDLYAALGGPSFSPSPAI